MTMGLLIVVRIPYFLLPFTLLEVLERKSQVKVLYLINNFHSFSICISIFPSLFSNVSCVLYLSLLTHSLSQSFQQTSIISFNMGTSNFRTVGTSRLIARVSKIYTNMFIPINSTLFFHY